MNSASSRLPAHESPPAVAMKLARPHRWRWRRRAHQEPASTTATSSTRMDSAIDTAIDTVNAHAHRSEPPQDKWSVAHPTSTPTGTCFDLAATSEQLATAADSLHSDTITTITTRPVRPRPFERWSSTAVTTTSTEPASALQVASLPWSRTSPQCTSTRHTRVLISSMRRWSLIIVCCLWYLCCCLYWPQSDGGANGGVNAWAAAPTSASLIMSATAQATDEDNTFYSQPPTATTTTTIDTNHSGGGGSGGTHHEPDTDQLAMVGERGMGTGMSTQQLQQQQPQASEQSFSEWWSEYWSRQPFPSGYTQSSITLLACFISVIIFLIVTGNLLVVIAIFTEKSLKPTQNWFIASLAVSDMMLGLAVMPFSLARELMGFWVFGQTWCDIHEAMDVLLTTASINTLCLISLDRYWSITQAVSYLKKRTPRRSAMMIAFVWMLSAMVSLPPLIGWKKQSANIPQHSSASNDTTSAAVAAMAMATNSNNSISNTFLLDTATSSSSMSSGRGAAASVSPMDNERALLAVAAELGVSRYARQVASDVIGVHQLQQQQQQVEILPRCQLSDDIGYVLYSALGSFYIPCAVMVFTYIKIFLAARTRARRAINKQTRIDAAMAHASGARGAGDGTTGATPPTQSGATLSVTGAPSRCRSLAAHGSSSARKRLALARKSAVAAGRHLSAAAGSLTVAMIASTSNLAGAGTTSGSGAPPTSASDSTSSAGHQQPPARGKLVLMERKKSCADGLGVSGSAATASVHGPTQSGQQQVTKPMHHHHHQASKLHQPDVSGTPLTQATYTCAQLICCDAKRADPQVLRVGASGGGSVGGGEKANGVSDPAAAGATSASPIETITVFSASSIAQQVPVTRFNFVPCATGGEQPRDAADSLLRVLRQAQPEDARLVLDSDPEDDLDARAKQQQPQHLAAPGSTNETCFMTIEEDSDLFEAQTGRSVVMPAANKQQHQHSRRRRRRRRRRSKPSCCEHSSMSDGEDGANYDDDDGVIIDDDDGVDDDDMSSRSSVSEPNSSECDGAFDEDEDGQDDDEDDDGHSVTSCCMDHCSQTCADDSIHSNCQECQRVATASAKACHGHGRRSTSKSPRACGCAIDDTSQLSPVAHSAKLARRAAHDKRAQRNVSGHAHDKIVDDAESDADDAPPFDIEEDQTSVYSEQRSLASGGSFAGHDVLDATDPKPKKVKSSVTPSVGGTSAHVASAAHRKRSIINFRLPLLGGATSSEQGTITSGNAQAKACKDQSSARAGDASEVLASLFAKTGNAAGGQSQEAGAAQSSVPVRNLKALRQNFFIKLNQLTAKAARKKPLSPDGKSSLHSSGSYDDVPTTSYIHSNNDYNYNATNTASDVPEQSPQPTMTSGESADSKQAASKTDLCGQPRTKSAPRANADDTSLVLTSGPGMATRDTNRLNAGSSIEQRSLTVLSSTGVATDSATGAGTGGPTVSSSVVARAGSGRTSSNMPTSGRGARTGHVQTDNERHKRKLARARERRATLILGLIMGCFVCSWMPFFTFYITRAICSVCRDYISRFPRVEAAIFWMGYCNSAINPIIYTIFNRDFRRAFRKILFKWCPI